VNEIRAWNSYHKCGYEFAYRKLASGAEVNVVIDDLGIAIEIKSSSLISNKHLVVLIELAIDQRKFKQRMVVLLENTSRMTSDNILIFSLNDFLAALWKNFKI